MELEKIIPDAQGTACTRHVGLNKPASKQPAYASQTRGCHIVRADKHLFWSAISVSFPHKETYLQLCHPSKRHLPNCKTRSVLFIDVQKRRSSEREIHRVNIQYMLKPCAVGCHACLSFDALRVAFISLFLASRRSKPAVGTSSISVGERSWTTSS